MNITENKAWNYGIGIFPVALLASWLVFPFLSDGDESTMFGQKYTSYELKVPGA